MPVFVRTKRLHEAASFFTGLLIPPVQQPCLRKNSPCAGGAYRDDIAVQHHVGKPPISFKWIVNAKPDDGFPLPLFQPEITWDWRIVFIGLAITVQPRMEFALAYRQPFDKVLHRDSRFLTPCPGKINYGVSRIMGNPDAL